VTNSQLICQADELVVSKDALTFLLNLWDPHGVYVLYIKYTLRMRNIL